MVDRAMKYCYLAIKRNELGTSNHVEKSKSSVLRKRNHIRGRHTVGFCGDTSGQGNTVVAEIRSMAAGPEGGRRNF